MLVIIVAVSVVRVLVTLGGYCCLALLVIVVVVVIKDWVDYSWSFVGRGCGGGGAGRYDPVLLRSPDDELQDEVEKGWEESHYPS